MSDYKHILDVWQTPETTGIFTGFQKLDVPWKSLNNSESLNIDYYYNHSGQKIISPLVRSQLNDDLIDSEHNDRIARIIYTICNDNWTRIFNALSADYSPIENVDSYLTETTDRTGSGSHNETEKDSGTDTHTKTGTETLTESGTDTTTKTGTETLTQTGTDTNTKTGTEDTADTGTVTSTKTGTDKTEGSIDETVYHHEYITDTQKNPGGTSETINGIAGFNSDEYSKDTKSTTTVNQEITTVHRTVSVQTDKDGNPVKDDNGEEIERPGKNSDKTDQEHKDTTTYNTQTQDSRSLDSKTTYNTTDEDRKDLTDETRYDTTEENTFDKSDTTTYNTDDTETLDLQHTRNGSESSTGKEDHTLHRHGNIGVTTNQQMITEELKLRENFFYEIVFRDIDKYLTLSIY